MTSLPVSKRKSFGARVVQHSQYPISHRNVQSSGILFRLSFLFSWLWLSLQAVLLVDAWDEALARCMQVISLSKWLPVSAPEILPSADAILALASAVCLRMRAGYMLE